MPPPPASRPAGPNDEVDDDEDDGAGTGSDDCSCCHSGSTLAAPPDVESAKLVGGAAAGGAAGDGAAGRLAADGRSAADAGSDADGGSLNDGSESPRLLQRHPSDVIASEWQRLAGALCCCCCMTTVYVVRPAVALAVKMALAASVALLALCAVAAVGVLFPALPDVGAAATLTFQFFPLQLCVLMNAAAGAAFLAALLLRRCRALLTVAMLAAVGNLAIYVPLRSVADLAIRLQVPVDWRQALLRPYFVTSLHFLENAASSGSPPAVGGRPFFSTVRFSPQEAAVPLFVDIFDFGRESSASPKIGFSAADQVRGNNLPLVESALAPSLPKPGAGGAVTEAAGAGDKPRIPVLMLGDYGRGAGGAWPLALASSSPCVVFDADVYADSVPRSVENVREIVAFIHRHSQRYRVDPGKLVVLGNGAGGALALLSGLTLAHGDSASFFGLAGVFTGFKPRLVVALYPHAAQRSPAAAAPAPNSSRRPLRAAGALRWPEAAAPAAESAAFLAPGPAPPLWKLPGIFRSLAAASALLHAAELADGAAAAGGPAAAAAATRVARQVLDMDPFTLTAAGNFYATAAAAASAEGAAERGDEAAGGQGSAPQQLQQQQQQPQASEVGAATGDAAPPAEAAAGAAAQSSSDYFTLIKREAADRAADASWSISPPLQTLVFAGTSDRATPFSAVERLSHELRAMAPADAHHLIPMPYAAQGFDLLPTSPLAQIAYRVVWDLLNDLEDEEEELLEELSEEDEEELEDRGRPRSRLAARLSGLFPLRPNF